MDTQQKQDAITYNATDAAKQLKYRQLMEELCLALINGTTTNLLGNLSESSGHDLETVYIPVSDIAAHEQALTHKGFYFLTAVLVNYKSLRSHGHNEKDSMLIAYGRAYWISQNFYPLTARQLRMQRSEIKYKMYTIDDQTHNTDMECMFNVVTTEYGSLATYQAELHVQLCRAHLQRIKFIHLYQDLDAYTDFEDKLRTVIQAEQGSINLLKMSPKVFRGIYHAFGLYWLMQKSFEILSTVPQSLSLRFSCSPNGAALIPTCTAALRMMDNSPLSTAIPSSVRTYLPLMIIATQQIQDNQALYATHAQLYGYRAKLVHPLTRVMKVIGPMLIAFLKVAGSRSAMAKQKVIAKLTADQSLNVDQWVKTLNTALTDQQDQKTLQEHKAQLDGMIAALELTPQDMSQLPASQIQLAYTEVITGQDDQIQQVQQQQQEDDLE